MIQIEGFNIRIVRTGDAYGWDDCLTHDGADALVEFYDAKVDLKKFGPRGQFVSRYLASTILGATYEAGLQLDGGVPQWAISTRGMRDVKRYLCGYRLEAA